MEDAIDHAVASVVIQKLKDMLSDESFNDNKVIHRRLEKMMEALNKLRGFIIGAADSNDYLHVVYCVEDTIESFALGITRQRKWLGFLMNSDIFLKNFTACKMLSRGLKNIQKRIEKMTPQSGAANEDAENEKEEEKTKMKKDSLADPQGSTSTTSSEMKMKKDSLADPQGSTSTTSSEMKMKIKMKKDSLADPQGSTSTTSSIIRDRCQQSKFMYNYSYDEEELKIVGFDHHVPELLDMLIEEENFGVRIILIVGELGSGKTMLARAVYGNKRIKNCFNSRCAWATISRDCTTTDLLLNLLSQVEKNSEEQGGIISEELLKTRLQQHLKDQRYLIVIDGVSSSDQWESLKNAFPDDSNNGSKIIITICQDEVAILADPTCHPHYTKKLGYEQSWSLLLKKVGLNDVGQVDSNLKEKIVQACNGVPLKIILLGSLLSTKKDEEWASILDKQKTWETSDILQLCYNDLDAHLKLCLLYLMIFPKEYDIPVRRAQRLWVAEGFVMLPENQNVLIPEDVAQEYFDELVKRSLIQVSKLRSDGRPRKFRLLGILYDTFLMKARDISLFHVHSNSVSHEETDAPLGKRRLIEYGYSKNWCFKSSQYQHLRSYISFNFQKKDTPAKYVDKLLRNVIGKGLGLLRVLDLEGVYRPSLPENLGNLSNLRYLGLRRTFLEQLPKSVGDLQYLETLDLKHTDIDRIPPSVWKLKQLRHLILDEIGIDMFMPRDSMPRILTLLGLSVDPESPVKNVLSKLTQLRELGMSFRLSKRDDDNSSDVTVTQFAEDLVGWIATLTTLQSLRLRSKDDISFPSALNLMPFSGLNNLSRMNLLGKLQMLPDKNHFPPNIKFLTLSVSQLDKDPMPILGQLPSLTVLSLLCNSYLGEKIVCPRGTFEKLEVLKLWMLKELKVWELEEGAMEKLEELNIRSCSNLGTIPSRLFQQISFKDLILTNMPEKFNEDLTKMKVPTNIKVSNYYYQELQDQSSAGGTSR